MATRFTPITSGQPQQSGEIDNLISAIQSIRQMRKQMKDEEWKNYTMNWIKRQNERTAMMQGREDELDTKVSMLSQNPHTSADVVPLFGQVPNPTYQALLESSTDVTEKQKQGSAATISMIGEVEKNPWIATSELMTKADQSGADIDKVLKVQQTIQGDLRQLQLLNKTTGGGGKDGEGTGEGKSPDLIYAQAQDMNKILQMRSKGGYVINGVTVKAKQGGDAPAIAIKDADGYEWQLTNKGVFVWHSGAWNKANKSGKGYKSTKGKNLELPEGYARALEEGYKIYQDSKIGATGKSVVPPGQAVDSLIGDY